MTNRMKTMPNNLYKKNSVVVTKTKAWPYLPAGGQKILLCALRKVNTSFRQYS